MMGRLLNATYQLAANDPIDGSGWYIVVCATGKLLGDIGALLVLTQVVTAELKLYSKIQEMLVKSLLGEAKTAKKLNPGAFASLKGKVSTSLTASFRGGKVGKKSASFEEEDIFTHHGVLPGTPQHRLRMDEEGQHRRSCETASSGDDGKRNEDAASIELSSQMIDVVVMLDSDLDASDLDASDNSPSDLDDRGRRRSSSRHFDPGRRRDALTSEEESGEHDLHDSCEERGGGRGGPYYFDGDHSTTARGSHSESSREKEQKSRAERLSKGLVLMLKALESRSYSTIPRPATNFPGPGHDDPDQPPYRMPVWLDDATRYWLERVRVNILLKRGTPIAEIREQKLVTYARGQRGVSSPEADKFEEVARQVRCITRSQVRRWLARE